NITTFEQPLESREVETILKSVGRRTYKYRCKEEPCRSFCQAKVCMTRQFGIKPEDDPEAGDRAGMVMMDITGITK
ncbi:primase C-terminal domain-containing protein, partial [Streptococcus pyogenes]